MQVLIIAHFHQEGLLREDTRCFLEHAITQFDKVLFVSTKLLTDELPKFHGKVEIIIRENVGYDFYSYRLGILKCKENGVLSKINYLHLMNTSFICFEPTRLISNYFQKLPVASNNSVWGLTESSTFERHLQSYLISLPKSLITKSYFFDWWETLQALNNRWDVIIQQEIGFSKFLLEHKTSLDSIYRLSLVNKFNNIVIYILNKIQKALALPQIRRRQNPIQDYFLDIYKSYGIVKIELLRLNPYGLNLNPLMDILNLSSRNKKILAEALQN